VYHAALARPSWTTPQCSRAPIEDRADDGGRLGRSQTTVCLDSEMPRISRSPFALAFLLFRVWTRLSPAQRRMVVGLARAHGPRLAAGAAAAATTHARRRFRTR
jgi:hypothetical protein